MEKDKKLGVKFMKKNKKTKEDRALKEESLDEIAGGDKIIRNIENNGNYNIIGNNANYQQMIDFINKLDSSGKLDYLKRK